MNKKLKKTKQPGLLLLMLIEMGSIWVVLSTMYFVGVTGFWPYFGIVMVLLAPMVTAHVRGYFEGKAEAIDKLKNAVYVLEQDNPPDTQYLLRELADALQQLVDYEDRDPDDLGEYGTKLYCNARVALNKFGRYRAINKAVASFHAAADRVKLGENTGV